MVRHSLPLPETILKSVKEEETEDQGEKQNNECVAPWLLGICIQIISLFLRLPLRLTKNHPYPFTALGMHRKSLEAAEQLKSAMSSLTSSPTQKTDHKSSQDGDAAHPEYTPTRCYSSPEPYDSSDSETENNSKKNDHASPSSTAAGGEPPQSQDTQVSAVLCTQNPSAYAYEDICNIRRKSIATLRAKAVEHLSRITTGAQQNCST